MSDVVNQITQEVVQGIQRKAKLFDIIERVVWTLLQVVTGEILRNLLNGAFMRYNVVYSGHVMQLGLEWVAIFTMLLAILKNVIAAQLGNGTGSTLPQKYEPVPPDVVTTTTTVNASVSNTPVVTPVPAPVDNGTPEVNN